MKKMDAYLKYKFTKEDHSADTPLIVWRSGHKADMIQKILDSLYTPYERAIAYALGNNEPDFLSVSRQSAVSLLETLMNYVWDGKLHVFHGLLRSAGKFLYQYIFNKFSKGIIKHFEHFGVINFGCKINSYLSIDRDSKKKTVKIIDHRISGIEYLRNMEEGYAQTENTIRRR